MARMDRLITMCRDRESALRTAAEAIEDGKVARELVARAGRWARLGDSIQAAMAGMGAVPRNGGSVAGALQRTWIDIKAAANEREAIRRECARREEVALRRLEVAYEEGLPASIRGVVEQFLRSPRTKSGLK